LSAQHKKHFFQEKNDDVDKICFHYSSSSGNCKVLPSKDENALNIYGYLGNSEIEPVYYSKIDGRIEHVYLDIVEANQSVARSVGLNFLSRPSKMENDWNLFFSKDQNYNLDFTYGIGTADIDLSGLSVNKVNIKTGSADVRVGYHQGFPNQSEMDTFRIEVDMGNVDVQKLDYARSKYFIADVGFGNLSIDVNGDMSLGSQVFASVGAGNFYVNLSEKKKTPIKIILKSSPLCKIKVPGNFKKIEDNIYVNEHYASDSQDALVFNLDVGMGSINFNTK
jgi:hypothetical protein